jgi:hypothetical protein
MLFTARYDLKIGIHDVTVTPGTVMHVAGIREVPRLWIRYVAGTPSETWKIQVVGTGAEVPADAKYLGTAIFGDGELHAFRLA